VNHKQLAEQMQAAQADIESLKAQANKDSHSINDLQNKSDDQERHISSVESELKQQVEHFKGKFEEQQKINQQLLERLQAIEDCL